MADPTRLTLVRPGQASSAPPVAGGMNRSLAGWRPLFAVALFSALLLFVGSRDIVAAQHRRPTISSMGVRMRYFRTRIAYYSNSVASFRAGRFSAVNRLLLAGDIELNPGPGAPSTTTAAAPPLQELTIHHTNVRSLKKQLGSLRAYAPVLARNDVFSFSETWLNDTVADSELELGFSEHTWFRRDRARLGGGVACAVRSSLLPLRLPDPPDIEVILVRLQRAAITIAVCYRPPDDDPALERIAAALSALQPGDGRLVVIGDFNLPEVGWTATTGGATPTLTKTSRRAVRFLDAVDVLGLKQWVSDPTRGSNILDLAFSRIAPMYVIVQDSPFNTDHKELLGTLRLPLTRPPSRHAPHCFQL